MGYEQISLAEFAVIDEPIDSNFLLVFCIYLQFFVFFLYFVFFYFYHHLAVTNLHLAAALVENRALHFSGIEFHRQIPSQSQSRRGIRNLWAALFML